MKRFLVALLAGAAVFAVVFGAAATLSVDGNTLQGGYDGDLTCDQDGINVSALGPEHLPRARGSRVRHDQGCR